MKNIFEIHNSFPLIFINLTYRDPEKAIPSTQSYSCQVYFDGDITLEITFIPQLDFMSQWNQDR